MWLTKPDFYDSFVCIADRCTDNCCIGWEIDIDPVAMERFSKVEGEFGERLRGAIIHGECPTFANTAGERCALLREDGLCELVLNLGEDSLCDICALHPRFFGWYGDVKEAGLGLCCEEVCRLLLSRELPLTFVTEQTDEPSDGEDEMFLLLRSCREKLFGLLQNREIPLGQRLCGVAENTLLLQEILDNGGELPLVTSVENTLSKAEREQTVCALLKLLSEGESVSEEWTVEITELCRRGAELSEKLPHFLHETGNLWKYEHIAVYWLYRWYCKGCNDGEIVSKMGLALCAVLAIALMDCKKWIDSGSLSDWDRTLSIKLYSKQTEYSEEITEQLCDAVWDEPLLSLKRLGGCFVEEL